MPTVEQGRWLGAVATATAAAAVCPCKFASPPRGNRPKRPFVLAVYGVSGAGKSTIASQLVRLR
eukprot:COSAG02_NODE_420_length_22610_cov_22.488694_10_plen_64_part_00